MAFLDGKPLGDVVSLLMIQLAIIITMPKLLHFILTRLWQPLVFSEILAGVILGPSVLGWIPGFMENVFPPSSIPLLNALAQLGLVLFLFIVGMSMDYRQVLQTWKLTISSAILGAAAPFAVAVPIAFWINDIQYTNASFKVIILILVVVVQISALAVLARLLAEIHMLQTDLAPITLSTTAVDTFIGWIFLAIVLSINETEQGTPGASPLNPLWIVLIAFGHFFLLVVGRIAFICIARRVEMSGQICPLMFYASLVIVFCFAWFTQALGISGMFGAFEVGFFCVPKGVVMHILLPVFFALSGLHTKFQLLDGTAVLIVLALSAGSFLVKFVPISLCSFLVWRLSLAKSFMYGILMTTKGVTALAMMNICLGAGIITEKLFSMFVLYSLLCTVMYVSKLVSFSLPFSVTPLLKLVSCLDLKYQYVKQKKPEEAGKIVTRVFILPRSPHFATSTTLIVATMNADGCIPIKCLVGRLVSPDSVLTIDIFDRKQLKEDHILLKARAAAKASNLRPELMLVPSPSPANDILDIVEGRHPSIEAQDLILMGYDSDDVTYDIIHKLMGHYGGTLAVLAGATVQPRIERIMIAVPVNGTSESEVASFSMAQRLQKKTGSQMVCLFDNEASADGLNIKMKEVLGEATSRFVPMGNIMKALKNMVMIEKVTVGLVIVPVAGIFANRTSLKSLLDHANSQKAFPILVVWTANDSSQEEFA